MFGSVFISLANIRPAVKDNGLTRNFDLRRFRNQRDFVFEIFLFGLKILIWKFYKVIF